MNSSYKQMDTNSLYVLLGILRGNLSHLETQAANHSPINTPLDIINQINYTKTQILSVTDELNSRGYNTTTHDSNVMLSNNNPAPYPSPSNSGGGINFSNSDIKGSTINIGNNNNVKNTYIYNQGEYIKLDFEDFSQLSDIISSFHNEVYDIFKETVTYNNEIEFLINSYNTIPKSERSNKFRLIINEAENSFLRFGLSMEELNRKYDEAIKQAEFGLKEFLNIKPSAAQTARKEILRFKLLLQETERKAKELQNGLQILTDNSLKKMMFQEERFVRLNKSVELCIVKVGHTSQLMHTTLQLFWSVLGRIDGLLRSS